MREPEIPFLLQRRSNFAFAARGIALLETKCAERVARRGHRRLKRQRSIQLGLGRFEFALVHQHLCRLLVGLRVLGIDFDQPPISHEGVVVASYRAIDVRHVEHRQVVVRLQRQSALEALQRTRELAPA